MLEEMVMGFISWIKPLVLLCWAYLCIDFGKSTNFGAPYLFGTRYIGPRCEIKKRKEVIEGKVKEMLEFETVNGWWPNVDEWGLRLWPFVQYHWYSYKADTFPIQVEVETKEDAERGAKRELKTVTITVVGSMLAAPDKDLFDIYRIMSDKNIRVGLEDAIKKELNIIAGQIPVADFADFKEEIDLMINCILRLKWMPHYHPLMYDEDYVPSSPKEVSVPASSRLAFYRDNRDAILQFLLKEQGEKHERSELELRFGINVSAFNLADVILPPSYVTALRAEKEATARAEGFEATTKMTRQLAKEWRSKGEEGGELSASEAANLAGMATGLPITKQVHTFEGLAEVAISLGKAIGEAIRGTNSGGSESKREPKPKTKGEGEK